MSRSRGFTLVEMLAATGLAAMLVLAGLQVLRSIDLPGPAEAPSLQAAHLDRAAALIRWDLSQAVLMQPVGEDVVLAGFGSLDPLTLLPNHRPVVVRYAIEAVGDTRWLVREQRDLDTVNRTNSLTQLVVGDVSALRLATADAAEGGVDMSGRGAVVFRDLHGLTPIPRVLRLELRSTDGQAVETLLYSR